MSNQVRILENEWITLPDGRRLAARLWLPAGPGPFPAILEYLPYRKRDGTAPRDETTHPMFAEAGFACVRVDIAGTGDSEGTFDDEYSEQELSDGEAVLAWIAAQVWCDGNIGMIGISWGGFNGLQLAFRRPQALKAVVSVASTSDRYADDIHFMGGCLLSDNANWASQMFAYLSRPADPDLRTDWREDWVARMESLPFLAADWLKHPTRDAFWKHGSVCEDWSRITVPVLAVTGWADAYVNTPQTLLENLHGPIKALVGPWEHRYPHISKLLPSNFHSEVIGWFDRWLKHEQNGAEDLPDYRTFMQEHSDPSPQNKPRKGRWIAEETWPSPNIKPWEMHLKQGALAAEPSDDVIEIANPAHLRQASGYFCAGMRIDGEHAGDQAADDALSVCFDLKLEAPLEIMGRPQLKIAFSVDRPVAQIVARLCDVSPGGVSQRITYRPLNLTHYRSHEAPEALVSGRVYEAEIPLNACAHRFNAGHVMRLALSSSYWPIVWPAPAAATITLHCDNSNLSLPVRNANTETGPANPRAAADFPVLQENVLRPPAQSTEITTAPDGTITQNIFDDFGKTRDPGHGLVTGSHVRTIYVIHPDNPASSRFRSEWQFTFERGDWAVAIDTENEMTCDEDNFYLHRKLRATEGSAQSEVLVRDWQKTIPRGLL